MGGGGWEKGARRGRAGTVNSRRLLRAGQAHGSSQPPEVGTITGHFKDESGAFLERKGQLLPAGSVGTPGYRAELCVGG